MNYINKLQEENAQLQRQITEAREEALQALLYYTSAKFHGRDANGDSNDYAHVSTDVIIRINEIMKKL